MKFLLDANAVIAILKGHSTLLDRLKQHQPSDFGVPAVVVHELYYGAFKSQKMAENLDRVEALQFQIVELDREDARQSGRVRAALAQAGTPIGPLDVLIAGQALARSLVLITHNVNDFQRVTGLRLEDWEA